MSSASIKVGSFRDEWNKMIQNKEKILLMFCKVIIVGIALSFLMKAFFGACYYHEPDSYMLPTISMQYRQTLIITQADIDQAKIDYPTIFEEVDDFDTMRSSKLVKSTETEWVSFYFPVYAFLCMPAKLVLQLCGMEQFRAFLITNALFVIAALIFAYKGLKCSPFVKFMTIALLAASPIHMYIQYISCEAMLYSMIIISLTLYQRRKLKLSALVLSFASMANPTIMGIGIAMVGDYFVRMIADRKKVKILSAENILRTLKYGCSFVPCLIPFAFNFIFIGSGNPTAGGATLTDLGYRFLAYLFDINLGFFSFAPVTLIVFFVFVGISLKNKRWYAITVASMLLITMLAFSLMIFIDCVPTFCARYIMWAYAILVMGIAVLADDILVSRNKKLFTIIPAITVNLILLTVNHTPMYYFGLNRSSEFLLNYCPVLYNPYYSTFYSRNNQLNWPYETDIPSYYTSTVDGYVRKIMFCATDDYKLRVISSLTGDDDSMAALEKAVNETPSDGRFHYLNFSPLSGVKLTEKNVEQLGYAVEKDVVFQTETPFCANGHEYYQSDSFVVDLKPYTLYKAEIKFDESDLPKAGSTIYIEILDGITKNRHSYSFSFYGKQTEYEIFFNADTFDRDAISDTISINSYSGKSFTIDSFVIKEMETVSPLMDIQTDITTTGGMQEDKFIFETDIEPFVTYKLTVIVDNPEDLTDLDELYYTVYFDKRYPHYVYAPTITVGENVGIIKSNDTTLAMGPIGVGIYGKTQNPIKISSIRLERT